MNSEYENKLQNTPAVSPMDKLKAASKTAVRTIEETSYQPIVYAIPKEDWNAFREWTKQAVTFQPTLYQQIAELTTKEVRLPHGPGREQSRGEGRSAEDHAL